MSRGGVVVQDDLIAALKRGQIAGAGLDVFEVEPLGPDHALRSYDKCIFGSHNGSNTVDAVRHVSHLAIDHIAGFLKA